MFTVHRDGKLLPALDDRKSKEGHLLIVISYGNKEQFIAVSRLESSLGSERAKAVCGPLYGKFYKYIHK